MQRLAVKVQQQRHHWGADGLMLVLRRGLARMGLGAVGAAVVVGSCLWILWGSRGCGGGQTSG